MLSNTKIKYLNSLKLKKNRQATSSFIAEGDKIVKDILLSGWEVSELFANRTCLDALAS